MPEVETVCSRYSVHILPSTIARTDILTRVKTHEPPTLSKTSDRHVPLLTACYVLISPCPKIARFRDGSGTTLPPVRRNRTGSRPLRGLRCRQGRRCDPRDLVCNQMHRRSRRNVVIMYLNPRYVHRQVDIIKCASNPQCVYIYHSRPIVPNAIVVHHRNVPPIPGPQA